jgi:hypothetical protein
MRSDRLKQVMQQLDPNFDERNAGYNRFSKFVSEAGIKGLLKVTKLDNGQFEVAPMVAVTTPAPKAAAAHRRGGPAREAVPEREEGRGRRGGRGRGRGRARAGADAPRDKSAEPSAAAPVQGENLTLAAAFQLLTRALAELPVPVGGEAVRARMAALHGKEDSLLDPDRFVRFLRQANDAEIADVRQLGDGSHEVAPHRTAVGLARNDSATGESTFTPADGNGAAGTAGSEAAVRVPALRFRRGSRAPVRPLELPLVGVVRVDDEPPVIKVSAPEAKPARGGRARSAKPVVEKAADTAPPKKGRPRSKKSG